MPDYFDSGFTVGKPAWHGFSYVPDRNPTSLDELLEWTFCYNSEGKIPGAQVWEPTYAAVLTTIGEGRCESKKEDCREPAVYWVSLGNQQAGACEKHAQIARQKGAPVSPIPTVVNNGWQAIKRSDTGALLHVSRTSFETYQNRESAELLMQILEYDFDNDEDLKIRFETGMILKSGGMVVFCVSLDLPEQVPGDNSLIRPYASIHNYHDGTGALKVQNTSIREVCWNTANAAEMEGEKTGRAYSFRHSKNIRENIDAAIDALKNGRSETKVWVDYATELVAIPAEDTQFEDFLEGFVPEPPKASDRVMNNVMNARQSIRNIYYNSPTTETIRGTAWGVVSSAIEYLDHKRTFRTKETYVSRTMLKPEYGKHQAMELIAEIVGYDNEELLAKVTSN